MKGKLYVVATPIGNLSDFSFRGIEILNSVDLIAAEDTRNSMVLLNKYNIKTKITSNHKFNEASKVKYFIEELLSGKSIAVISDAGTPCISDPGYILIKEAIKNNIEVIGIPGSSAVITALSISGFDTTNFSFYGFLPKEKKNITNIIKNSCSRVLIFYESPRRILQSLEIIKEVLQECNICLCNDLTKKFEKVYYGKINEVINELELNKNYEKGEYTLVIEKNILNEKKESNVSLEALIIDEMIKNKCSMKEAIKNLSNNYNKNDLYKASLNLKEILKR